MAMIGRKLEAARAEERRQSAGSVVLIDRILIELNTCEGFGDTQHEQALLRLDSAEFRSAVRKAINTLLWERDVTSICEVGRVV